MAARKLQSEIDRTLKKVAEGVEFFEGIYDKMQASTNQTQKEKLELDLKSQIKKLQRLRDQIKTWVASNDIKDKSQLLENRKLIETQMEKFKACEKEMKTKAYSKEGLTQAAKMDPKELEKEEAMSWLQEQVEKLQIQIEGAEAEVESLQGTGKKKGKAGATAAGRQEELETLNERRKWHISRLEIILRLLNNGSLQTEQVNELKEDVKYFVESNTEEDFEEDEGIYDELNLDEEEEKFGLVGDDDDSEDSEDASEDIPPRTPKKHDEESITSSKRSESPILKKTSTSLGLRKTSVTDSAKPPPNLNFAQQPMSSILKAGLQQSQHNGPSSGPTARPSGGLRYAAAAAAAVAPPATQAPTTPVATASNAPSATPPAPLTQPLTTASTQQPSTSQEQLSGISSSPSLTHPSVASPMLSSAASISQQPDGSSYESPALSEAVPSSVDMAAAASSDPQPRKESISMPPEVATQVVTPSVVMSSVEAQQPVSSQLNGGPKASQAPSQSGPSPLPQQVQLETTVASSTFASTSSPVATSQAPQFPPGVKRPPTPSQQHPPVSRGVPPNAFPGSLSDLVASFESVKQKAATRMNNMEQVHKMLEGGASGVPQPQDTEKPKYYVPRNPYQTPPYYPQVPNPLLSTPALFSQLDVETLFYVFYYLPGTYQQYLAAKELKRQSWRFHVKYLTWFQRHSEPQAITEEYEQGVYVYFDWEGSWCQRKKSDFRFEYRYLSED